MRYHASSSPDVIVVGSGFGGAVAAARLSQAGRRVLVLERGRRWERGTFPRGEHTGDGWIWQQDRGLYDIRWLDGMASAQAAGWGGGSLVYANVFARPPESILGQEWPEPLRRTALNAYYDLAAHMLEVSPVQSDPQTGAAPVRTELLESLARRMGREAGTVRPNLAVRFGGDLQAPGRNRHGFEQWSCTFVGECVAGCNQGAKSSVDRNYLALAERHGAAALTGAEVDRITVEGNAYVVRWRDLDDDGACQEATAPVVIVAAGALSTTELLLRCRDVEMTLPHLSRTLGSRFSGNGDALEFASAPGSAGDLVRGPTITTTTILDVDEDRRPVWFQVQDGGMGEAVPRLLGAQLPGRGIRRLLRRYRPGAARQRAALLSMGSDAGAGRLHLDHTGEIALDWSNAANAGLYRAQGRVSVPVQRLLGMRVRANPLWSVLRRGITVHPLGGAPTAASATDGVVDVGGEVHGYPGLFVFDGASMPGPTGVNPSATILATAEWRAERLIRRLTDDPSWRAPEWPDVRPVAVPEDAAAAAMAERHAATRGGGIRFTERMVTTGRADGPRSDLRLSASIDSLDRLAAGRDTVALHGIIDIDGLATARDVTGRLTLFPENGDVAMRYELGFLGDDGLPRRMVGVKPWRRFAPFSALYSLTTLRAQVSATESAPSQEARSRLILRIRSGALVALIGSLRGVAFTRPRRIGVVLRFAWFFAAHAFRGRS